MTLLFCQWRHAAIDYASHNNYFDDLIYVFRQCTLNSPSICKNAARAYFTISPTLPLSTQSCISGVAQSSSRTSCPRRKRVICHDLNLLTQVMAACWFCRAGRGIFSVWLWQRWENNNTWSWCSSSLSGTESNWNWNERNHQWCQCWLILYTYFLC